MKKSFVKLIAMFLVITIIITDVPMSNFFDFDWGKLRLFKFNAEATTVLEDGYYSYMIENGGVTITDCDVSVSGNLVIPDTLGGYFVKKIGKDAFKDCKLLSTVSFPKKLETIEAYAFESCTSLTSVTLPSSLKNLSAAFINCTSLERVYIPKSIEKCTYASWGYKDCGPFAHCSALKTVSFESGITKIPDNLFLRCNGLENITIPETVTEIGARAFEVTSLSDIIIPDSVTKIGRAAFKECGSLTSVVFSKNLATIDVYAFESCTSLTSVTLPSSLKNLSAAFINCTSLECVYVPKSIEKCTYASWGYKDCGPFAHCTALKTVNFESGITKIPDYLFFRCSGLENITIPETVTEIGISSFESTSLSDVIIPDSVTKIGRAAFKECSALKSVNLSANAKNIGREAFNNCPNLLLYVDNLSTATVYAIENDILFSSTGTFKDNGSYVLDRNGTEYFADTNSMSANGYITMTVDYRIKSSWYSKISGMSVKVLLPKNCELDESTLRLDGVLITDYKYDNNRTLTIPIKAKSGKLIFSVKVNSQDNLLSCATITFKKNNVQTEECIGTLCEKIEVLTLDAPNTTSSSLFDVSGVAPTDSLVTLYLDGAVVATATSSKAGLWFAQVQLKDNEEYKRHTLTAKCTTAEGILEQTAYILFDPQEPELDSFTMKYNEHNVIKSCSLDSSNQTMPVVYFLPGTQFDFELSFTNPEEIKELYVTSTRNNVTKYLKAEYDEEKGKFVTDGYFDPSNKNYVPGVISYEYKKEIPEVSVGDDINWEQLIEFLPDGVEESSTVKTGDDKNYEVSVDLGKFSSDLAGVYLDAVISTWDEASGDNLSDWMGLAKDVDKVISYVLKGASDEEYTLTVDFSDPTTALYILKEATGNKFYKFAMKTAMKNAESLFAYSKLADVSNTISAVNGVAAYLYKCYEIDEDMDNLHQEVLDMSFSTSEERTIALNRVEALRNDQKMFSLAAMVIPALVAGSAMAGPGIVFTALLGCITASATVFWQLRKGQIKGGNYKVKMVVDPSGYVYDIETNERLENVKATAYFIEYDESEDFWDNVPASGFYGIKWDASEYNQANPLYTNSDGKYAWDVPEGWWRVKYEKEGYVTVWSDWMPVPPPQTEINIGMQRVTCTHSYKCAKQKDANCVSSGYAVYVCSKCGSDYTEEIPAKGHEYSKEWTVDKVPTATVAGSKSHHCTRCDSKTDVTVLGALGIVIDVNNSNIRLSEDANYLYAMSGMTVEQIIEATGKETQILNADGTTVEKAAPIASGMKIVLKDKDGKILDEKTIIVLGDVGGDGDITAADARLALRASVGLENLNEWQALAANVDDNPTTISAADARLILRASVGLETL